MTKVTFYFDPVCPFSWITSRWLHMVASEREIEIDWQPFSLALKNDAQNQKTPDDHTAKQLASHRLLRVMLAAKTEHQADLAKLYTSAGIMIHIAGLELNDQLILQVLSDNHLPEDLLKAADDVSRDKNLQTIIDEATSVVGQDAGVPIIVFGLQSGSRLGYFGPVLDSLPDKSEALELWDGLSKLATSKTFYELKRTRPNGNPDVFSTAKC